MEQLRTLSQRSAHPLLHLRLDSIEAEIALLDGDSTAAERAAHHQAQIASDAGLLEMFVDALLLQARACTQPARRHALLREAHAVASTQGFGDLATQAQISLAST